MSINRKHVAEKYVDDVLAGRIVTGKLVKLACQRHRSDLANAKKLGIYFDTEAADRVLFFFTFLRHSKGEWAGDEFGLQPWQQFILYCLFGWKNKDGYRRYRTAHLEFSRKNGKTTLMAGVGLYLAFADGEAGAEVYCAATKKDQARILFEEAEKMRAASPGLKKKIKSFRDNMNVPSTGSKFQPLGADEDTLDGLNLHGGLVDELHAHKNRKLWDVLLTARGSRKQPLVAAITTAGTERESICFKQREYGIKVLEGFAKDESFFVYIATLDEGDDPFDEKNWPKSNPNLGVSVYLEGLREEANKAKQDPSSVNAYLRLRMNMWTNAESAAIDSEAWNKCVGFSLAGLDAKSLRSQMEERLAGQKCYIAVDLASTQDIACELKIFPPVDEDSDDEDSDDESREEGRDKYIALPRFYVPQNVVEKRIQECRQPYDVWIREGFLTATEGDVIDYRTIQKDTLADFERYEVAELAFDPYNATSFTNLLQEEGIAAEKLVKFPQTVAFFAEPTKLLLETLIQKQKIAHLGNPILGWMASNLLVKENNNGAKRPVKGTNRGKIDGIVALIMAIGRATATPAVDTSSVYDERGIEFW